MRDIDAPDVSNRLVDLPHGWSWSTIGETGQYVNGFPFKPADQKSSGLPIIRIQNLTSAEKPINRTNREVPNIYYVEPGELLVSWSATIDVFVWRGERALLNQHIFRVLPDTSVIEERLLYYWLKASIGSLLNTEHLHGSTMKHINRGPFMRQPIPLPPRDEQRRLADKLDELFSDLDAGVAELRAAQKKLAKYRQSLLAAAFDGALSKRWRNANSASDFGDRQIDADRFQIPDGWTRSPLGDLIAEGPQNGLYLPASLYGSGQPILRIDDFQSNWHRARRDLKIVNADEAAIKSYSLRPGDLIINRVNSMTHLGKVHVVRDDFKGVLFESNMMRLRVADEYSVEFISMYFSSAAGRKQLTKNAKWAVNQASINQQDVKNALVPLPSREEQIVIVDQLKRLFVEIDLQSTAIDRSLKQATAQRQNILKCAFSGQLVAQDPSDEPASVLLDRIRAERAAMPSKLSKRPRQPKAAA